MKTLSFTFDGHDYHILCADDDQREPHDGDTVVDALGNEVCYVTHDGEYWVAEDCTGPGYSIIHENDPDAAWSCVLSAISC